MIKYALIASVFALGCGSAPLGVENIVPDSGGGNASGTGGATSQGDTGGASNSTGGTSDTGGVTGSGGDTSNSTGGTVSTGGADNSGGDTGNATGGSVSTGGDTSTGGMTSDTGGTTNTDVDASTGGVKDAGNDTSTGGNGNDSSVPPPVCTPASCVLTQGYWKNHPDWAVQSLEMGGVTYSKDECLALLNFPSYTDGSVILARQLIAALLNGGACDPNILATVKIAQDWMAANKDTDGALPYGTICVNPEDTGCTAIAIGAELDRYNSGLAGTPACK